MSDFKFYGSSLIWVLSLALTGCLGENLSDHPDLLSTSAHCNNVEDFGACLLSSYVNHPAAMSFPEKLEFSPYYAQIIQTGYDREGHRKAINKFVDKDFHKERNDQAFKLNDMNLYARSRTPDGTRQAISILNSTDKTGVRHLDPAFEQWLETPTIFDNDFVSALLLRYSENWMQKSTAWDRTGMMPEKFSFEVLSRSFEKIGDKSNAEKMIADMKKQRFYPLREKLKPVYLGRKKLTRMNGPALKKVGFSAMAIMPLIDQQIENDVKPSLVFSNLAFAIRHGHGDNRGDEIVKKALNYAYKRKDKRSIIKFSDQIISIPETFSNDMNTVLKRSDRLSQDLVLVQYLSALGDHKRIEKLVNKWNPLSTPLANGKLPTWTATSIFDYIKLLHHADRSSDVQDYIQAWEGKLMRLTEKAEFVTTML